MITAEELLEEEVSSRWKKLLGTAAKLGFSVAAGATMVLRMPKLALSFMVARGGKFVGNVYAKILWGALLSVAAMFLLLNVAELAVLATALAVGDALSQWTEYVNAAGEIA